MPPKRPLRWALAIVGAIVWGVGLYYLAAGSNWGVGGGLMIGGGLCLIFAASGGWSHFWEGLTNWLYFWR